MKQSMMRLTAVGLLLCFTVLTSYGQADSINVVTTAVPFLRISPDARAGGMGDVALATSPDANAQFYNLAKYPFAKSKGAVAATYTPWLKDLGLNDVYMATLAGYYKFSELEAVSASLRYFSLGSIQFTDNLGNDISTFRPREFAFDAGYSRKLSDRLSLGIALRYIYSNLASGTFNGVSYKPGHAVAGDLGVYYTTVQEDGHGWNLSAALTNLGTKISYTTDATQKDYIPANLGLGASHTWAFNEIHKFTLAMDVHKLLVPTPPSQYDSAGLADYRNKGVVGSWFSSFSDAPGGAKEEFKECMFGLGAEYWYNDQFAVRTGYYYEDKTKGNRKYFTIGAGIKYSMFGLNFSYLIPSGNGVNRNPLSNTIRFSVVFDFDNDEAAETKTEQ